MFSIEIMEYYLIGLTVCVIAMGLFVATCVVIGKVIDMLTGGNNE